jgi:hypothetical protein
MPLSDDDKKEVAGIVTSTLGLAEGQTFDKLITNKTNDTLNAYDKRTKKDREKAPPP